MMLILSFLYRFARRCVSWVIGRRDYETTIQLGHFFLKYFSNVFPSGFRVSIPSGFQVKLYHLVFPSPIILSSFEGDPEMVYVWTQFGLGGATLKTVMPEARPGNARPRILRMVTASGEGLLNAMGLPGKGWRYFMGHLDDYNRISADKPLGISVGGHTIDDYYWAFEHVVPALNAHAVWSKRPRYFELNISCPNTSDGQSMLAHPELLDQLLTRIRAINTTDIIGVKLSPDQSNDDLHIFASIVAKYPLMYLAVGNTTFRRCEALGLAPKALTIGGGGLSGPELFPRTSEMVKLLAPYGIPLIAIGGIGSPKAVHDLLASGASLVACATSMVADPYWVAAYYR